MNKKPIKFKSIEQIQDFISKVEGQGQTLFTNYLEDTYQGLAYIYSQKTEGKEFVKEYNKAISDVFKLVSE